jgi:hypothetical protein
LIGEKGAMQGVRRNAKREMDNVKRVATGNGLAITRLDSKLFRYSYEMRICKQRDDDIQ